MSRQQRFLFGAPQEKCNGGILQTDQLLGTNRCHTSREEAMRCYSKYLTETGFVKLSRREFQKPGEPIRILPKLSKFGGRLRSGKGEQGSRFEPEDRAGLIF